MGECEWPETPIGCISSLTPTVCRILDVKPPNISEEPVLRPVVEHAQVGHSSAPLQKCLIFIPDAIGAHLWRARQDDFDVVRRHLPLQLQLRSVVPPKTPVCLASMFTGAQPDVHGIREPKRPVLKCDTLFDALIRSGKKIAIVTVQNSTLDLIFRGRNLDYFSEPYDPDVARRTLDLLQDGQYDIIVSYQQEYDDLLHKSTPLSSECLQALNNHLRSFEAIAEAVNRYWKSYPHALIFAPDHGAHTDPVSGKGDHGENIPEDMLLFHCYGISI